VARSRLRPHLSVLSDEKENTVAKKADRKDRKKARKARAKSDRALLELGEDLLTAVHLHQAVQDEEVHAALAGAHADLVQASEDLVARIATRFLDECGTDARRRDRFTSWTRDEAPGAAEVAVPGTPLEEEPGTAH
jgi:hypothetical protein